jgi:hypothetical protein
LTECSISTRPEVKKKEQNIHCIGINLEAEREWARLDREKALGQQEDEEEEVQWQIRRRKAGASQTLLPSSSATRQPVMAPTIHTPPLSLSLTESDRQLLSTPPASSSSGTRQPPLLPPRVKKKTRSSRRREAAAKGKKPAQADAQAEREREQGAAALLRRATRAAKAAEQAEGPDTGWLDSWTNIGLAIYGRNNQLLVPGRKQGIVTEEDPAAVADGAAMKPMSEQTEPTLQPPTNTRSSPSAGPPEKQPWTFGGSYWPSRKKHQQYK